jgi:hypothetical protein
MKSLWADRKMEYWNTGKEDGILEYWNNDEVVKSRKRLSIVIPAKAEIQQFHIIIKTLDTGFHR